MKKLIQIAAIILAANFSFGQTLQTGNLVGLHIMTINLNPNATMGDFKTFYIRKVIPGYEKQFRAKGYLVKGIRGEHENTFGIIWIFKTGQARDKFFNLDGSPNDAGKSAIEKIDPLVKELGKIGTYTTKYTDWVVQ